MLEGPGPAQLTRQVPRSTAPAECAGRVTLGMDAAACAESTLVPGNWLGTTHEDVSRRGALAFDDWAELTPVGTAVLANPPYTPVGTLRAFLKRAVATATAGREVWALVPAATGSAWFQDLVVGAGGVPGFLRGRLTFTGPHSTGGRAPWPSAIVVYRASTSG
jgi:hypothetical protein